MAMTSTIRKAFGPAMRLPALARAAVALLLLAAWGGAARAAEPRPQPVRPLAFEANRGQAGEQVKFLARGAGYTVFLTSTDAVVSLRAGEHERAVVRVRPVGASAAARIVADGQLPGVANYPGRAPGAPPVSAPTYERVRYVDLYPGIDLVYYGRPRELEYDFVVGPGADPGRIALTFDGAERVAIDTRGDLVLHTAAGALRQPRPVVYQEIDGARRAVAADYVVDGEGRVRFHVGAYDAAHPLVIDPLLAHSTYLGGTAPEGHWGGGAGIAVDGAGNVYVVGTTESLDFPTTAGADQAPGGGIDIFVTKFSPTGAVVYSTYLGGPCNEYARAIAVDTAGNAYVTGRVDQTNCYTATPGALVAKLGPTGAVLYSVILGGGLVETSQGRAIAVDSAGHAYVTGTTDSVEFPTTPGALRTERCVDVWSTGTGDGFVAKLSADGSSLIYSTFLCGSGDDVPFDIAVDAAGNAYVGGTTGSHDFPTVNPLQPAAGNSGGISGVTGFVSKLAPDGSHLVYSTYLGGSTRDFINGLAVDGQGNVYVTGQTQSTDFPTTAGVLQEHGPGPLANRICGYDICYQAVVASINASGSALVYSTYLYGEADHGASRIAVDTAGHAHVVGWTNSSYFPIKDAFQPANRGLDDAFIVKLSPDGTRLVYASYLGGSHVGPSSVTGLDMAMAIALDAGGNAHVAGYTLSYDFPTTPDAFQPALADAGPCDVYGGPCSDAFVATVTAGGPGVVPALRITATPTDIAPGGTVTATWAGLSPPTGCDYVVLNALGSGRNDFLGYWLTGGTASGSLSVPLPADLPLGSYELRLLTPAPGTSCYTQVVARSEPFRVAPAAPDLVVASVATTPAQPAPGQPVAVTVSVTNQGAVAAGPFAVDFYKDRSAAPGPGVVGDVRCAIASLLPAASTQCTGSVTYAAAGTFSAWAQVDTGQAVAESSEADNVSGPRAITVVAPAGPDLVVVAVGNPPAGAAPGSAFAAADTVRNAGATSAVQSTTRFYLSLDGVKDAGDTLLGGSRAVPGLAPGAQSAGTTTVTIPLAAASGTYRLIACADDARVVAETDEANNCLAAAASIVVGRPDLVETAVTDPPAAARPGTSFAVTDTARNQGLLTAAASTTRYYLSADAQKSSGDRRLGGSRSVPSLAPGATSAKTVTVTIPSATPPGTYRLLACADDTKAVTESDEGNNCLAAAGSVTVARPDLVQQSVANAAGPFRRGTAFTVSDSVRNDSLVATPRSTATRYYLSVDGVRNTGDTRLTGARTVPILAAGATSSGPASVTIPSTMLPGTYVVLACADDGKVVVEASETNNCRASGTPVSVTP